MKILIIGLLCLMSFSLMAESTIVDSVYAIPELDGDIAYYENGTPHSINSWTYVFEVGDLETDSPENTLGTAKSFISFPLIIIPHHYQIQNVNMRLYQIFSHGGNSIDSMYYSFPHWDVVGGDTIKCIVSHIDYGNTLDINDWSKGDIGNPYTYQHNVGTITHARMRESGYRYLDITPCVLNDYALNRQYTQYRIAFEINTDCDNYPDVVGFASADYSLDYQSPQLFFTLFDPTENNDQVESILNNSLCNIAPNPLTDQFKIKMKMNKSSVILIQIYDVKGRMIDTITNSYYNKGEHLIEYRNCNLSTGIYLVKIKAGKEQIIKKITCLK